MSLRSDDGASFDADVLLAGEDIAPQVTWGTSPEDVVSVTGSVPRVEDQEGAAAQASVQRALDYMGLQGGEQMEELPVDVVFIGSCTNGRIEDMREVGKIIEAMRNSGTEAVVDPRIREALIVPGSGLVKKQAEEEGLGDLFRSAGFDFREPVSDE